MDVAAIVFVPLIWLVMAGCVVVALRSRQRISLAQTELIEAQQEELTAQRELVAALNRQIAAQDECLESFRKREIAQDALIAAQRERLTMFDPERRA